MAKLQFQCVDCGHEDSDFKAGMDMLARGSYTYRARCPKCSSYKVDIISDQQDPVLMFMKTNIHITLRDTE